MTIDRPFRFTLDFCIVWFLLTVPAFYLTHHLNLGPWYSHAAVLIVAPLFAAFVLYGPVLLARQIIHSGTRGGFVARVFLSILGVAFIVFGGFWVSGFYTESGGHVLGFIFAALATAYLNWRLKE